MRKLAFVLGIACAVLEAAKVSAFAAEVASGVVSKTGAPAMHEFRLSKRQAQLARENRLELAGPPGNVALQWESIDPKGASRAVCLGSPGKEGGEKIKLRKTSTAPGVRMEAGFDPASGQIVISESAKPVLQYNYKTVEAGEIANKVSEGNRIYARSRSDYIHPLYGLHGEILTKDWSLDHPHHRGIYWAWPELDYGSERGDLHALQRVFARPTGKVITVSGPVFAQVEAENQWLWEDRDPIVLERTLIRAYQSMPEGRFVDLAFEFTALKDGVTVARRGTTAYGGLNIRMATPTSQEIAVQTDPLNSVPRRCWSDISGVFAGSSGPSGLLVLQSARNPDYPGDWVQYPELSWCQPTFPASGTRYALRRDRPLVLRFRLWVHSGGKPSDHQAAAFWDSLHASAAAFPSFAGEKSMP